MRKMFTHSLFSLLLLFAGSVQGQWALTQSPTGIQFNCFANSQGLLWAASNAEGGVYWSGDNGATWQAALSQPPNKFVNAMTDVGGALYAATDSGVYQGYYAGSSWTARNSGLTNKWVAAIAFSSTYTRSDLYAGTIGSGIFHSTDYGVTWTAANSGLGNMDVISLAISGNDIFAGTYYGVYLSTNYGATWSFKNFISIYKSIYSLAVINGVLYAGTDGGGVFVSSDSGTTWTTMNDGLTNLYVHTFAAYGPNIFAGTNSGVFLLMNGRNANSWTPQNSGLPSGYIYSMITDNGALFTGDLGIYRYSLSIFPQLVSVKNVPFTEGGSVDLAWTASSLDTNIYDLPYYSIWRAISPAPSATEEETAARKTVSGSPGSKRIRIVTTAAGAFAFQWVGEELAHRLSMYSYAVPTLSDSMAGNIGLEYFMISAETNNANVFYDSNIDSGYSVDMLAPAAPRSLTATVLSSTVTLHWLPNTESDLKNYEVFRSDSAIANTKLLTPYGTTTDTTFTDTNPLAGTVSYYAVCAADVHDNVSAASNQISITVTGVDGHDNKAPKEFSLAQNYPNPFNPSTIISYQLPVMSQVTLKVYDILGREVATLVNERQNAGSYDVTLDASRWISGMYFYRLTAKPDVGNTFSEVRKFVLLK